MNLILIPIYNDWKSLNKLLITINRNINHQTPTRILVVDDCSQNKIFLENKKLKKIKKIEILRLKRNVGSQKAIAIGLNYLLKKKKEFDYVTVMDGDGEDNPSEIEKMLRLAKKNKDSVIVSCRKDRNENFLIKILYKVHLLITVLFTWKWITFGNFSVLFRKNLNKILSNQNIWKAYSASLIKNTNIKRVYAVRSKRFYGKSQVNLMFLALHSLRIISVFYLRVIFSSLIYSIILYSNNFIYNEIIILIIVLFNIIIMILIILNQKKIDLPFIVKKIK